MSRSFMLILLTCMFLLFPQVAFGSTEDLAVVFVMDNSGSMQSNDPGNIRFAAASMLVDLLHSQDKAGLVEFSTSARALVPLSGLGSLEQREAIKGFLAGAHGTGEWTDVAGGLETAFAELEKSQQQGIIILVTDGEPDPGPDFKYNTAIRTAYLNRLQAGVSKYSAKGWPIYSIGLSNQADIPLLQQLSQETGGMLFRAQSADALPGIFQDILAGLRDNTQLAEFACPLSLNQWSEPNLVRVNNYQKLLTFRGLNTQGQRIELQVKDPNGNILQTGTSGVTIVQGPNYYSLSIDSPRPGNWVVQARGEGTGNIKAEAESQFSIQILEPTIRGYLPINSPVRFKVQVSENGLPVNGDKFSLYLQAGDKKVLTFTPDAREAGVFAGESDNLLEAPGPQTFRINLSDSGGEVIGKNIFFYGKDSPYLTISPLAKGWLGEQLPLVATVMYKGKPISGSGMQVAVSVTGPDKSWNLDLSQGEGAVNREAWEVFSGFFIPGAAGQYKVDFHLKGVFQQQPVDYETGTLSFDVGVRPVIIVQGLERLSVGKNAVIRLEVKSQAVGNEQLTVEGSVGDWKIPPQVVSLLPGEQRSVELEVPWELRGVSLPGVIKWYGPNVKAQESKVNVYFRTPIQDVWYTYSPIILSGFAITFVLVMFLLIGNLLFRYNSRKLTLRGMLVIGPVARGLAPRRLVPLQPFNKTKLLLGWGQGVDIVIEADSERSGTNPSLVLEAKLPATAPNFLTGWLCLLGKAKPVVVLTSNCGSIRLKGRKAQRPLLKTSAQIEDGDEITCAACRILFRK